MALRLPRRKEATLWRSILGKSRKSTRKILRRSNRRLRIVIVRYRSLAKKLKILMSGCRRLKLSIGSLRDV